MLILNGLEELGRASQFNPRGSIESRLVSDPVLSVSHRSFDPEDFHRTQELIFHECSKTVNATVAVLTQEVVSPVASHGEGKWKGSGLSGVHSVRSSGKRSAGPLPSAEREHDSQA
jgi:hypothetical protein